MRIEALDRDVVGAVPYSISIYTVRRLLPSIASPRCTRGAIERKKRQKFSLLSLFNYIKLFFHVKLLAQDLKQIGNGKSDSNGYNT